MNLRLISLCLAALWAVAGAGMLAEWYTSPQPRFVLPVAGGISLGWPALAFAVYNVVRWWAQRDRTPIDRRAANPLKRPSRTEPKEYLPDFDFTRPADPAEPNA